MLIDLNELIEKYDLNIKGIIHCGAHEAEESSLYKKIGVDNVVWIEANPEKSEFCKKRLANEEKNIVITEAVNDKDGEKIKFNITNNGESSSILKLKNHKNFYPQIDVVQKIEVTTKRIDTIIDNNNLNIDKYNFLNLDLQGIELRAIKSLGKYLQNIDYIYTEVNKEELYEGCDIVDDIDNFLYDHGFVRLETVWTHADWGDALYIKAPKLKIIVTTYNNENWTQTNIESIIEQKFKNYEVLYIDDHSSDDTYDIAEYLIGDNSKFKLIKNEKNMSKAYSFMKHAKNFVDDEDIVIFIDGDDWISYNDVFENVAKYYIQNQVWVAYSKMLCYPSLKQSPSHGFDHPHEIHKYNAYRQYPFTASHLKTMKGFLFKNMNEKDLIYKDKWIRFGDDVALMCCAMEQSPIEKIGIIDYACYVYNQSEENSIRTTNDYNNNRESENYIRSIKPYSVISDNTQKYISPRMLGRLGNQMFQIASAYSFAIDNNSCLKVSIKNGVYESLKGEIGDPMNYKNNIYSKIDFIDEPKNCDIWKENSFNYKPISYKFANNLYLEGHFQSEKYFSHNRESILKLFSANEEIKDYILQKYGDLLSQNTVSLHIRRGDYLLSQNNHPICDIEYYDNAISQFNNNEVFLIFSDDLDYVKKTFIKKKYIIIENEKDYIDMYMMSMCKNNIIANSSFSWWGAWLNNNLNKKVIAPKKWFGENLKHYNTQDLIPENWIIL
jgi:FkbM family methyltransferase